MLPNQMLEIVGPRRSRRRNRQPVFENQIPTDHPCDEFAERRIRVRVRASGYRNHRREFRIAQRNANAHESGKHVGENDAGAGSMGAGADRRKDPAEHRAEADSRKRGPSERASQPRLIVVGRSPGKWLSSDELAKNRRQRLSLFRTDAAHCGFGLGSADAFNGHAYSAI